MASQAKIPHFPLFLCLLLTLAITSQATTQIKNFNKVSRENFNKQASEQATLPKDTTTTTTTTATPLDSNEPEYGLYSQKRSDPEANSNDEFYGDRQFEVDNSRFPTRSDDNALRKMQYDQWNQHQLEKQQQKLKAQSQDSAEGQVYKRTSYKTTPDSLNRNDQQEYEEEEEDDDNNNNNNAYDNEKFDDIALRDWQFAQWNKYQLEKRQQKLNAQSQDSERQAYRRTSFKTTPDSWNWNNDQQDSESSNAEKQATTDDRRWGNNNYKYGYRAEEYDQKNHLTDSNINSYEQQQQPWKYENVNTKQKKGLSKEERSAMAQGMSDTRRLRGGKYYYDIENDKYGEDHPFTKLNSFNANEEEP
ncbi:ROX1 homologue [Striga asiatica]|uniref:ROX1 homologue n=1 Tax=Striga asiatica TaxID=4170 RepID=A0A5A7PUB8_STRAF|nr:ROX1 homologue [Striga asiatica]